MVNRIGNVIEFTPEEIEEFNVPAQTTPDDAVQIALGYREAGLSLIGTNAQEIDDQSPEAVLARQRRMERATRLGSISSKILDNCMNEHLAVLLDAKQA